MKRLGNTREARQRQLALNTDAHIRSWPTPDVLSRNSDFDSWGTLPRPLPTSEDRLSTAQPQLLQRQVEPSAQSQTVPTHASRVLTFKNVRRAQSLNSNSRSPQGIRGLGSFPGSRWSPRTRYRDMRRAVSDEYASAFAKACSAAGTGSLDTDADCPLTLTSAESWLLDRGFSRSRNGSGCRRRSGSGLVAACRVPSKDDEETAIMVAAREGNLDMCRFLCGQKETVNDIRVKMIDGSTPLMAACRAGHKDVVVFLFEHGAADDVFVCDNYGATPFLNACLQGHLEICKLLYLHAPQHVRVPNDDGTTPMLVACDHGHLSIAKFLHAHGAADDVRVANKSGWDCMMGACMNGHLEVVRWLLDNGATTGVAARRSSSDGDGRWTPLFWACQKGHAAVVDLLIENGGAGDLLSPDKHGCTPMYVACQKGRLDVCRTLARHGNFEDALVPDANGVDACTVACRSDKLQHVCKWLLMCGAPVRAKDFRGRPSSRLRIIEWARETLHTYDTFISLVLCAMMGLGATDGGAGGSAMGSVGDAPVGTGAVPLAKLAGVEEARLLVADFAGVPHGPHLRHLRYLPVAFSAISWNEVDGADPARNSSSESEEEGGQSEGESGFFV